MVTTRLMQQGRKRVALLGCLFLIGISFSMGSIEARTTTVPNGEGLQKGFIIKTPQAQSRGLQEPELEIHLDKTNMSHHELRIEQKGLKINGKVATSYTFHKKGNVVIAAVKPVSHITVNSVKAVKGEKQEVMAVFQHDHKVLTPKSKDIGVFDLHTLEPLDFSTKTRLQGIPKNFILTVLLDKSGSMGGGTMETAKKAIKEFMASMPSYAMCMLITFNTEVQYVTPSPANCAAIAMEVDSVSAEGGTDIYRALEQTYREGSALPYQHHVVITFTDGVGKHETATKEEVAKAKALAGIKTLVFWSGAYEKEALADLVDVEVQAGANLEKDIETFFASSAESINGQIALSIQRPVNITKNVP